MTTFSTAWPSTAMENMIRNRFCRRGEYFDDCLLLVVLVLVLMLLLLLVVEVVVVVAVASEVDDVDVDNISCNRSSEISSICNGWGLPVY